MKRTLDLIEGKNVLLRSVGGSGVEQLPTVLTLWEKFELMLDSHQLMIKEQVCYLNYILNINLFSFQLAETFSPDFYPCEGMKYQHGHLMLGVERYTCNFHFEHIMF